MSRWIGKFELRRLLGKGAQSAVYLAYDPQLDREVAIKTLHFAEADPARNQALLNEARAVAKLQHPHIVPIFDVGEQDGDPYLVFEYVEGRTLAQALREDGPMPAVRAAELMTGVADAVGHAHQHGVIHRDLKPSNILLDREGQLRVMDFGIALSGVSTQEVAELAGTPAYMAPEYVAQRIVNPQTDLFAAGLVLYEMVFGRRAVQTDDVGEALRQAATKPVRPPADSDIHVDEAFFDLIVKATAYDPELRFASAAQLRDALAAYCKPLAGGAAVGAAASTLDFLLRRMRHKSDFPAMSAAISAINRLAASDTSNANALSNVILNDFALTNKILRVANSASYRAFGGGNISTVSRAIVVLGFETIRSIALSLMLFEHLRHKEHAELLREEFLRANLGGILGRQLSQSFGVREVEESFICALFHNLGRLLTHFYFPEEAEAIARLRDAESCSEEAAAARVLGIGYEALGLGVAQSWGFPEGIVQSMQHLPPGTVPTAMTREMRLRTLSSCSSELSAAMHLSQADERQAALVKLRQRFRSSAELSDAHLKHVMQRSIEEVSELARVLQINIRQTRLGRQMLAPPPTAKSGGDNLPGTTVLTGEFVGISQAVVGADDAAGVGEAAPADTAQESAAVGGPSAEAILAAGIRDISQALLEDMALGDLLRIILETMYRAIGFHRVLLCMRDGRSGTMVARFGFGEDVDSTIPRFRFALNGNDIFNLILAKDKDVLIQDAADPRIARHMPDWYRRDFGAHGGFIVFPLRIRSSPVAMIYADKERATSINIGEHELALLRTLRNQAVLAIKQSTER